MGQLFCCTQIECPSEEEQKKIMESTGFPKDRVCMLYTRFVTLDADGKGLLCKADLAAEIDFSQTPLAPLVIEAFFFPPWTREPETAPVSKVTFEHFCQVFSLFLPHRRK